MDDLPNTMSRGVVEIRARLSTLADSDQHDWDTLNALFLRTVAAAAN